MKLERSGFVSGWNSAKGRMSWSFRLREPGRFRVFVQSFMDRESDLGVRERERRAKYGNHSMRVEVGGESAAGTAGGKDMVMDEMRQPLARRGRRYWRDRHRHGRRALAPSRLGQTRPRLGAGADNMRHPSAARRAPPPPPRARWFKRSRERFTTNSGASVRSEGFSPTGRKARAGGPPRARWFKRSRERFTTNLGALVRSEGFSRRAERPRGWPTVGALVQEVA